MGVGLMIGCIRLFDTVHDYTLQFTDRQTDRHAHTHIIVHIYVFTSHHLVAASTADVPLPLGSQTIPGHSYQLLTATVHSD
jgi:hypothetical protein